VAVRASRRAGRLSFDALVCIGFLSAFWQDTLMNDLSPKFTYNSYLINWGAWNPRIPGWISPHGGNEAESWLFGMPVYGSWFVFAGILFCALARSVRRRRPRIGNASLLFLGIGVFAVMDLCLELPMVRTGTYAYIAAPRAISIWGGHSYQFPVHLAFIAGTWMAIVGLLRFTRDDRGRSALERGVNSLRLRGRPLTDRARSAVAVLAFVGFANVVFGGFNVVYSWVGFYASPAPPLPSYLQNGLCGPHTDYPCPGTTRVLVQK
jgi:hypothetical protein